MAALGDSERLRERRIQFHDAGSKYDVSPAVAEGVRTNSGDEIHAAHESSRIKPLRGSRIRGFGADAGCIRAAGSVGVLVGPIARAICGERKASLPSEDSAELPASECGVHQAVCIAEDGF